MPRTITMVTGPIVGLNSTEYIDETIRFAESIGIKICSFNLFDEIIENENIDISDDNEGIRYI